MFLLIDIENYIQYSSRFFEKNRCLILKKFIFIKHFQN